MVTKTQDRRARTEAALIVAVGRVLARDGFRSLGVNTVAREAGTDKVLIYRYFGGLTELLIAYGQNGDFWYQVEDLVGDHLPPPAENTLAGWAGLAARRHMEALLARPETLEILAWEMVERNALTVELERVREDRALAVMAHLQKRFPDAPARDWEAFGALVGGAASYLAVRGRTVPAYNGVEIGTPEGRARLFAMIDRLATGLMREDNV